MPDYASHLCPGCRCWHVGSMLLLHGSGTPSVPWFLVCSLLCGGPSVGSGWWRASVALDVGTSVRVLLRRVIRLSPVGRKFSETLGGWARMAECQESLRVLSYVFLSPSGVPPCPPRPHNPPSRSQWTRWCSRSLLSTSRACFTVKMTIPKGFFKLIPHM